MFLRNWDNMRTSLTLGDNYSYTTNEDAGTQIQDTAGSYYNGTSETAFQRQLSLQRWSTSYYTYSASLGTDDNMIWPGGLINNEYLHKQTFVQPDKITYDDFNLYSPFYGYTSETAGYEIFGQNHVLGPINYNSELDIWERTVTREFKNISGFNITVTELGIYKGDYLIVRELLPEPIEVEDQCYFKLSFTYTVANPHENREIKINRLVSRKPSMIVNNGDVGNSYTVSAPNKKCQYLCIRQEDSSSGNKTAEEYFNSYGFDCGINWNYEIIAEKKYYDGQHYNYIQYFIISPVEDVEDKNIIFTTYKRTWYYYSTIYFYALDDAVTNIELLENTETITTNEQINLSTSLCKLYKTEEENNILWIIIGDQYHSSYRGVLQLENEDGSIDYFDNPCDRYVNMSTYLFRDSTSATEHTISIVGEGNTCVSIAKLKVTTVDNQPLYSEESVV